MSDGALTNPSIDRSEHVDENISAKRVVVYSWNGSNWVRTNTNANYAQKITVSGSNTYVAIAALGTYQASATWQVKKINVTGGDTVITWADSDDNFDNVATDLTTLTYG